jgi:general secretion pathway protein M
MNEYWIKVKEWWSALATREKRAVVLGGSIVALFIVYQGIWSPLKEQAASMRKRLVAQEKTLAWMQSADKTLQQIQGQATNRNKSTSPVMLLSVMQKQINQAGLEQNLTQLKQASNESIEMHFQKVDFDKLVKLLTLVIKEQRVSITQMSVVAESAPGTVNADVVLKLV